jgi:protein-arginine kinase activator protein McsA
MPPCAQCGTAPAAIDLTTIRAGTVKREDLCPACTATRGIDVRPPSGPRPSLKDFLQEEHRDGTRSGPAPDGAGDPRPPDAS